MESRLMKLYQACPRVVQTSGINLVEAGSWAMNHSRAAKHYFNLVNEAQTWSRDQFIDYQSLKLRQMVRFAFEHVPFYKRLYTLHGVDVSSIRSPDDLKKLPSITKKDVTKNWNEFIPNVPVKFKTRYTSGTTGSPLKVRISSDAFVINRASSILRDLWAGYDGQLTARFVGDQPVTDCEDKKLFRRSYVMNRLIFPSYCLSSQNSRRILTELRENKVEFIQCYSSTGYIIAKFLEEYDEFLPLKAVLYSSEPAHPFEREVMEERFQCKLYGFYGQAECLVSASECENGHYHLAMLDGILEIMRGDESVDPGERGFTVCTSLTNFAMPLIRYRLDDYTGHIDEECNCGRTTPTIYPIEAKMDDLIVTPSGRIISPCSITNAYKHAHHVMEAQIIQRSVDLITVKVVPQGDFSTDDESELREAFEEYLDHEVDLKIERVKRIYNSREQKKRRVINQISGDLFERAFNIARRV